MCSAAADPTAKKGVKMRTGKAVLARAYGEPRTHLAYDDGRGLSLCGSVLGPQAQYGEHAYYSLTNGCVLCTLILIERLDTLHVTPAPEPARS